jgi:hypothetical protein
MKIIMTDISRIIIAKIKWSDFFFSSFAISLSFMPYEGYTFSGFSETFNKAIVSQPLVF